MSSAPSRILVGFAHYILQVRAVPQHNYLPEASERLAEKALALVPVQAL